MLGVAVVLLGLWLVFALAVWGLNRVASQRDDVIAAAEALLDEEDW